jgi:hypothetical protein
MCVLFRESKVVFAGAEREEDDMLCVLIREQDVNRFDNIKLVCHGARLEAVITTLQRS